MNLSVKTGNFNTYGVLLSGYSTTIGSVRSDVLAVKNAMRSKLWRSNGISRQLEAIATALESEKEKMSAVNRSISDIKDIYLLMEMTVGDFSEDTMPENNIDLSSGSAYDGNINLALGPDAVASDENEPLFKFSDITKFLTNFSLIGGLVSLAIDYSEGNTLNVTKTLAKLVGEGAEIASEIDAKKIVDLLGLDECVDAIGFRENLAIELDKFDINSTANIDNLSDFGKGAKTVKSIAKWAGVALTIAGNTFENYDEFNGDLTNYRMYTETITESVIDIGLDVLVGAGVAAVATASTPAWFVGVAAAGIVYVADKTFEHFTGDDLSEFLSDKLHDGAEAVVDFAKETAGAIGDGISNAADAVAEWWGNLF